MNRNFRVLIVGGVEGDISYLQNIIPTQFDLTLVSENEMSQSKKAILDDIDMVILDGVINMSQMIVRVKKNVQRDGDRWVPIIITTWEPGIESEILAFCKGAYDYMVKPLISDLFVEKLRGVSRLLNSKQLANSEARYSTLSASSRKIFPQLPINNLADDALKPKLLVLENNCLEINVLMGVIANEFEPIIVKNNKEMRVTLEANNFIPDVILFDIKSGDRDGYDTLHYLTSHKDFRNIPLVLSSSDTRSKHVIRGLRAGATDYLTKPFCQSVVARLGNQAKISRLINPYLSIQ